MTHKKKLPVIRIDANHTGVSQEEGMNIREERFIGLAAQVELVEEARAILIFQLSGRVWFDERYARSPESYNLRERPSPEPCQRVHAHASYHSCRFPKIRRPSLL